MCLWPSPIVLMVVNNILYKKKTVAGNVKWHSTLEKQFGSFFKNKAYTYPRSQQSQSWVFIPEK